LSCDFLTEIYYISQILLLFVALYGLETIKQGKEQLKRQNDEFIKKSVDEKFFKLLDYYMNEKDNDNKDNDNKDNDNKDRSLKAINDYLKYVKNEHKMDYENYISIPCLILFNLLDNKKQQNISKCDGKVNEILDNKDKDEKLKKLLNDETVNEILQNKDKYQFLIDLLNAPKTQAEIESAKPQSNP